MSGCKSLSSRWIFSTFRSERYLFRRPRSPKEILDKPNVKLRCRASRSFARALRFGWLLRQLTPSAEYKLVSDHPQFRSNWSLGIDASHIVSFSLLSFQNNIYDSTLSQHLAIVSFQNGKHDTRRADIYIFVHAEAAPGHLNLRLQCKLLFVMSWLVCSNMSHLFCWLQYLSLHKLSNFFDNPILNHKASALDPILCSIPRLSTSTQAHSS